MSRNTRRIITILCLLAAAFVIWLDNRHAIHTSSQNSNSSQQQSAGDFERYNGHTFSVVNIVDGDTIDIDTPDNQNKHTRIRLWGVDTPETKNPEMGVMYFGPEAAEFTKQSTLGKQVRIFLETKKSRDKYGRLLAYVQLPDGKFLNEELLTEGFAYADVRFKHSYYHKYMQLESAARNVKKGLWRNVTRGQLPQWLQREKPNLLTKQLKSPANL